jgi:hypothetical protein
MKILSSLSLIIMFFFVSCNQSAQDMQLHDAQIKASVEQDLKSQAQREENLKIAKSNLEILQKSLDDSKANLTVENDKMGRIKEWQFGRAPQERDQQIRNQALKIEDNERDIKSLERKIRQTRKQIAEFDQKKE